MNMAFDPAYAAYGAGSEAKLQAIEASWSEGIRRIELLGTAAEHKRRFTDRFEPVYEGIGLAGPGEAAPQRRRSWPGSA